MYAVSPRAPLGLLPPLHHCVGRFFSKNSLRITPIVLVPLRYRAAVRCKQKRLASNLNRKVQLFRERNVMVFAKSTVVWNHPCLPGEILDVIFDCSGTVLKNFPQKNGLNPWRPRLMYTLRSTFSPSCIPFATTTTTTAVRAVRAVRCGAVHHIVGVKPEPTVSVPRAQCGTGEELCGRDSRQVHELQHQGQFSRSRTSGGGGGCLSA